MLRLFDARAAAKRLRCGVDKLGYCEVVDMMEMDELGGTSFNARPTGCYDLLESATKS